jgi:hypothetical protein
MQNRIYEFIAGIETAAQPDSGTPTLANDIVTKSYVDAAIGGATGTPAQEGFAGPGTVFVLANTPSSVASVKVYKNGVFQRQGTHYNIAVATITMVSALTASQDLDVVYDY